MTMMTLTVVRCNRCARCVALLLSSVQFKQVFSGTSTKLIRGSV